MPFQHFVPANDPVQQGINTMLNSYIQGKRLMFEKHQFDKREARSDEEFGMRKRAFEQNLTFAQAAEARAVNAEEHRASLRPFEVSAAHRRDRQGKILDSRFEGDLAHQDHQRKLNSLQSAYGLYATEQNLFGPKEYTIDTPGGQKLATLPPSSDRSAVMHLLPPGEDFTGIMGITQPPLDPDIGPVRDTTRLPGFEFLQDFADQPTASALSSRQQAQVATGANISYDPTTGAIVTGHEEVHEFLRDEQTGGFYNPKNGHLTRFGPTTTGKLDAMIDDRFENVDNKVLDRNITEQNIIAQLPALMAAAVQDSSRVLSEEAVQELLNHALGKIRQKFGADEVTLENVYPTITAMFTGLKGSDAVKLVNVHSQIDAKIEQARDPFSPGQWGVMDVPPDLAATHIRDIARENGIPLIDAFKAYNNYAMTHLVDGEVFDEYDMKGTMRVLGLKLNSQGQIELMSDKERKAIINDSAQGRLGGLHPKSPNAMLLPGPATGIFGTY